MAWCGCRVPERSANKFQEQLGILVRHEVDFIIVGGTAAVLEGAPIITLDLDIVFEKTPENISRLVDALTEVNAHYKDPAGRYIVPDAAKLATFRTNLLVTDLGGLDVLPSIADGLIYSDLLERSSEYEVSGLRLQVLNLDAVIETKEFADRDTDRAVLPILRRTLELKKSKKAEPDKDSESR